MPVGAGKMARRAFHSCRQMDRGGGSSFIRRVQVALTEYRRFDTPNEQRLYDDFLSQLNAKYFGELQTDTAESGPLGRKLLGCWLHSGGSKLRNPSLLRAALTSFKSAFNWEKQAVLKAG